jgi:hypothetical protein
MGPGGKQQLREVKKLAHGYRETGDRRGWEL